MQKAVQSILKLYYYTRREGLKGVSRRIIRAVYHPAPTYKNWKRKHPVSLAENHKQGKRSFSCSEHLDVICLFDGSKENIKASLAQQSIAAVDFCDHFRTGKGEYILLAGSDVYFYENAVFEFIQSMKNWPHADVIYCDHDINGKEPIFKPDFNKDLLLSSAYIGNVIIVRRTVLNELYKDEDFDNANIFAILLNLADHTDSIRHISLPLYSEMGHTSLESLQENFSVLQAYFKQTSLDVQVQNGIAPGTFYIKYPITSNDKISIIIPNRNHAEDLRKCIASIRRQTYKNIEIIIAENNSSQKDIFRYYKILQQEKDTKIIRWKKDFNYAAINNYAAQKGSGRYLLFLNNDIEFISENSIEEMLRLCQRQNTGAVGIKLFYPDGSIQHAGVIVGYGGIAGHAFLGCSGDSHGYMNRIDCVQNYNAVTAACMMVKSTVYKECGGFDERFKIAFNDIDFCLKMRSLGYDIVYTPYAKAWHFESKSRGTEDTFAKMKRFNAEVDLLRRKWKAVIEEGDTAYSPNLATDKWDFSINV